MGEKSSNNRDKPILSLILVVGLFAMLGGSLLGPTLPAISNSFHVSESAVGQVLGVYALTALLALPFIGYTMDRIGRKKVLVPCLVLNGIAGFSCILAPSFKILLVSRAL